MWSFCLIRKYFDKVFAIDRQARSVAPAEVGGMIHVSTTEPTNILYLLTFGFTNLFKENSDWLPTTVLQIHWLYSIKQTTKRVPPHLFKGFLSSFLFIIFFEWVGVSFFINVSLQLQIQLQESTSYAASDISVVVIKSYEYMYIHTCVY